MSSATIVDAWTEWASTKRKLSPQTVYTYRATYDSLLLALGRTPLAQATIGQLEDFIVRPRRGGVEAEPATKAKEVTALRSLWTWMRDRGIVHENPARLLVTPAVHNERPNPVSEAEWVHLWRQPLDDTERVAYGLALFCGLRRQEVVRLTTQQFAGGMISNLLRKGGKLSQHPWYSCVRMFALRKPTLLPSLDEFVDPLNALLARDGLLVAEWKRRTSEVNPVMFNKAMATRTTVNPHRLRHGFCSYMLDMGVPLERVSRLAGHASLDMTMRYVRTGDDPLADLLNDTPSIELAAPRKVSRWG